MTAFLRPISGIGLALILAACATGGSPNPGVGGALAQNAPCVPQSGTRIAPQDPHYSSIGRCHTDMDIKLTGAPTLATALPLLDTSITVQR
jgi:hypothetical protein